MDHGEEVEEATHDIVIIGGGIIGVSTAYFLAKHHDIKPLILEAKQIAWAASGKAGLNATNKNKPTVLLEQRNTDSQQTKMTPCFFHSFAAPLPFTQQAGF